jgi:hypothetical protein
LSIWVTLLLVTFRPRNACMARLTMARMRTPLGQTLYSLYYTGCMGLAMFVSIRFTATLSGLYCRKWFNQCVPFPHFECASSFAVTPLDRRSAGFWQPSHKCFSAPNSWMFVTQFCTQISGCLSVAVIQQSEIWESVHTWVLCSALFWVHIAWPTIVDITLLSSYSLWVS